MGVLFLPLAPSLRSLPCKAGGHLQLLFRGAAAVSALWNFSIFFSCCLTAAEAQLQQTAPAAADSPFGGMINVSFERQREHRGPSPALLEQRGHEVDIHPHLSDSFAWPHAAHEEAEAAADDAGAAAAAALVDLTAPQRRRPAASAAPAAAAASSKPRAAAAASSKPRAAAAASSKPRAAAAASSKPKAAAAATRAAGSTGGTGEDPFGDDWTAVAGDPAAAAAATGETPQSAAVRKATSAAAARKKAGSSSSRKSSSSSREGEAAAAPSPPSTVNRSKGSSKQRRQQQIGGNSSKQDSSPDLNGLSDLFAAEAEGAPTDKQQQQQQQARSRQTQQAAAQQKKSSSSSSSSSMKAQPTAAAAGAADGKKRRFSKGKLAGALLTPLAAAGAAAAGAAAGAAIAGSSRGSNEAVAGGGGEGEGDSESPVKLAINSTEEEVDSTETRTQAQETEALGRAKFPPSPRDKDPNLAFEAAEALAVRREAQRMRQLDMQQQEVSIQSLYSRAKTVSPSFNYVGIGYDSIKGNPLGDPSLMGDPGLRSPIIRFSFVQDEEGVTSDLSSLQPLGAYSRPFVACKQSENLSEVASVSDYVSELEADAQLAGGDPIGLYSFSASASYREIAKKTVKRNSKTFLLKTYCLRYEAGLAQTDSFNWNHTMAFDDAVSHLPDFFEGSNDTEACSPLKWREDKHGDACQNTNVHTWLDFIEQFGTHYIVRLFAGGKLTHQITMSNSDIASLSSSGVSVKAALKATFSVAGGTASTSTDTETEEKEKLKQFNYETETLIMGGRVPKDVADPDAMAEWSDSVEELPMPVKITLQPISYLLPAEKRDAFNKATQFYAEAVGMTNADMTAMGGKIQTIGEILRAGTQVMYAGEPPGFAFCPEHERVLMGFGLQLNFLDEDAIKTRASIKACVPGRDKCDGMDRPAKEGDDARIFVICGQEPIGGLEQVAVQSKTRASASCPEGTAIAAGFALSLTGGRAGPANTTFFPCRAGLTNCSSLGSKTSQQNFVWIACVDEKTPGLQNVANVARTVNGTTTKKTNEDGFVSVECPKPLGAAFGFTLELHTRFNKVRDKFSECEDAAANCSASGKGIAEAFFYRTKDTHALLAFVSCAELADSSPQTTSLEHQEGKQAESEQEEEERQSDNSQ
ncbi:hypothetical protein Efla_004000 [Eimeria flavescens]